MALRAAWARAAGLAGPHRQHSLARMASACTEPSAERVVRKQEVQRFIADCMRKAGASAADAEAVAHHLMTADYRGHFSHGMNRMQMYFDDIQQKLTDCKAQPKILTDFQVRKARPSPPLGSAPRPSTAAEPASYAIPSNAPAPIRPSPPMPSTVAPFNAEKLTVSNNTSWIHITRHCTFI